MSSPGSRSRAGRARAPGGHSIRVASDLTQIPIETLRVWERRYAFPKPARRADNQRRVYSDDDIARLRLLGRLVERGYRPGDVVDHETAELERLLESIPGEPRGAAVARGSGAAANLGEFLALASAYDAASLESELRRAAAMLGPRRFVVELAHPLAIATGEAWRRGELEIAQEHLLSQALRTQVRGMLGALQDVRGEPAVLLTTLPGEAHELGLEMVALYLALAAAKPRLLGAQTPIPDIVSACRALRADVVGLTVTDVTPLADASESVLRLLDELPRRVSIWVGGSRAAALASRHRGIRAVSAWPDLDEALQALRDAPSAR